MMNFLAARNQPNPRGPTFVRGGVARSQHVIEAFRHRNDGNTMVLAGESLLHSNIDVSWLTAASDTYNISSDPRDYVLVDIPIVTVDIPNRNMQAFPYEEVSYFDPLYGKFVYNTFHAKPCVPAESLVSTDRGLIPIAELKNSGAEYALTRQGKARIKEWQHTGYQAVATIETETGGEFRATANHPILVLLPNMVLKWKNVEHLAIGDVVVSRLGSLAHAPVRLDDALAKVKQLYEATFEGKVPSGKAVVRRYPEYRRTKSFPSEVTPELARVLGYLVSEGAVGKQISFSNTDPELIEDFRRCWYLCFGTKPKQTSTRLPNGDPAQAVYAAKKDLRVWFDAIGLPPSVAASKRVPWCIMQADPDIIAEFLCGYIEGDGCLSGNMAQMHSVSRKLLLDIKKLIESLGFDARVRLMRPATANRQDLWCLTVAQACHFVERIGRVSAKRKKQNMSDTHRSDRYRRIPFAKEFVRDVLRQHAHGIGYGRRYYDAKGNEVVGRIRTCAQSDGTPTWASQGKKLTVQHVRGVAGELDKLDPQYGDKLRNVALDDLRYETVTSIHWGRIHEPIYDIQTTAGQFVCDGVVVHNCHIDHENKDPLKAKGVIFDAALQYVPNYDVWKIRILGGWDRTKDPWLVDQILRKKRTGYSMGALVDQFVPLIAGTRVETERGLVPIESIRAGERVRTNHGMRACAGVVKQGYSPVIQLRNDIGLEILGAPNHPVLTLQPDLRMVWKEIGDLTVGDVVAVAGKEAPEWPELSFDYVPVTEEVDEHGNTTCAVCGGVFGNLAVHLTHTHRMDPYEYLARYSKRVLNPKNVRTDIRYPTSMTPELAALLGYWVSEGAWGDSGAFVGFCNSNAELWADYDRCFVNTFGIRPSRTSLPLGVVDFYRYLGLTQGYSRDKRVPWSILQAPREAVTAFMRAYFEGDGCAAGQDYVSFSTTSPGLAQDIQLLLLRLGVPTSMATTEVGTAVQAETDPALRLYTMRVFGASVDRFINVVGATSSLARERLEALRRPRQITQLGDHIPYLKKTLDELYARTHRGSGYYEVDGDSKRLQLHRLDLKDTSTVAYGHFDRWSDFLPSIRALDAELGQRVEHLTDERYFWTRVTVKNITNTMLPVYCVKDVQDCGHYFAEGYVVHNCSNCGAIDTNVQKCPCMRRGKGSVTSDNRLVFQACCGVNFIENSSVEDPADITADTDAIWE